MYRAHPGETSLPRGAREVLLPNNITIGDQSSMTGGAITCIIIHQKQNPPSIQQISHLQLKPFINLNLRNQSKISIPSPQETTLSPKAHPSATGNNSRYKHTNPISTKRDSYHHKSTCNCFAFHPPTTQNTSIYLLLPTSTSKLPHFLSRNHTHMHPSFWGFDSY